MSIILVRHGETPLNATRVLQPPDTPLSELGRAQARAVGERLARAGVTAIVSSDLARATMTAEPLAALTGLPIERTELLQERNFGALRGRPMDSLGFDPTEMEHAPEGGESVPVFLERVARAFAAVVERRRRSGGPLAVVTHGLVLRAILDHHAGRTGAAPIPHRLANTSVSILSAESPWAIELVNCTRHLDAASRDDGRGAFGV
ncbi:MAG: histidine phosphatase family protein [Burkholderiaceae bacterium]